MQPSGHDGTKIGWFSQSEASAFACIKLLTSPQELDRIKVTKVWWHCQSLHRQSVVHLVCYKWNPVCCDKVYKGTNIDTVYHM